MMDYRKSDMLDDLFNRYLNSYNLTLETEEVIGSSAYKYILECYTKNLKLDVKILDDIMKNYNRFKKIERKHEIKLENLNFEYVSDEEYVTYGKLQRLKYNFKRKKYERIIKKFDKVLQKYKGYIPKEYYENEIDEPAEEVAAPPNVSTENTVPAIDIQDENGADTVSSLEDVAEATTSIQDEEFADGEQIEMRLEDLFGDVTCNADDESSE